MPEGSPFYNEINRCLKILQYTVASPLAVSQGDYQQSHAITFTADGTSQSKTYTPGEIHGYGNGSKLVYESMDLTATFVGAKLFAKQVLKGHVSLYEALPLRGKPVYILQKPDGMLVALEEKVYFGLLKIHWAIAPPFASMKRT